MRINLVNDLGAPLAVTAVDLTTEATLPGWNEPAAYVLAGGGYLAAMQGFGGDFALKVGIASLPWAAKKIYERVRGIQLGGGGTQQLAMRRVSRHSVNRYPAPAYSEEFAGVRLD